MKLYARKMMRGKTAATFLRFMISVLSGFAAVFFLITAVYGLMNGDFAFFGDYRIEGAAASAAVGIFAAAASDHYAYFRKTEIFRVVDRANGNRFTLRAARRYTAALWRVRFLKICWALLFFAPAFLCAAAVLYLLKSSGDPVVINVLTAASALLAAVGAVCLFIAGSRYVLVGYLLWLNPLIPAREAVVSSAALCEGKMLYIALNRLSLAGWRLAGLLPVILPFSVTYCAFCSAVFTVRLFGEDKRRVRSLPVTFYIHSGSVFREQGNV